ncbi:class I SAM-dependent methyltransferase [Methanobacterium ferruginis]|uniref:class I SAM-dependent methyltransferase n=1 Tax=Methanobacterium ferruginis TaxID=710191 RepID=UPI002572E378|nr:class I SAM-dependent methyltransferase [Methanobacterium ferruginis]BDZ67501.1 methyltransferase [Methanobacterium ferruginis]
MSNDTGLHPSNGHRIKGRTSESFIDAKDVISRLDLKGNEVFMDAGCGDAHVAMIAHNMMDDEATIYAVDAYQPSIDDLKKDLEKEKISNVIPIQSDITRKIALDDGTVDICLIINVFHHFVMTKSTDEAINELKRTVKTGGKIAVMDYKKMDTGYGPPVKFKRSPEEVEEMFLKQDLKVVQLDTEVGEVLDDGTMSHYLIVFQKE